jgi:hypothetical protein
MARKSRQRFFLATNTERVYAEIVRKHSDEIMI